MIRTSRTRPARGLGAALSIALSTALAACGGGGASGTQPTLTVMTQNLYYGAEFDPVVEAVALGDPAGIVEASTQVWAQVRENDFATRAGAIADQIVAARPHLVGLQEAALFRTPTLELDYAQLVIDALAARGLAYEVIASVESLDAELPALTDDGMALQPVRITDRDVLLARSDLERDGIHLYRARAGLYASAVSLAGGILIPSGWVSVDVWIGGRIVRVVSTHLASDVEDVQRAQAAEAMESLFDGSLEVIFMGDFNSDALRRPGPDLTRTYDDVTLAGYEDAWRLAHPTAPGPTWGRLGGLRGPDFGATLTERIDHVFFSGYDLGLRGIDLVGEDVTDRRAGLWPSDHAGVVATFEIR